MYTVDTSVWVNSSDALEVGHATSRTLLTELGVRNVPIIVPTLLLPEVAGAIGRTRQSAALGETFALQILSLPNVRLVHLDDSGALAALRLAAQYRLRGADSVYAAVALANNCTLISLDSEHLTRLSSVTTVQTPAQALATLSASARQLLLVDSTHAKRAGKRSALTCISPPNRWLLCYTSLTRLKELS